jgi:hypothetical protein
MNTEIREIKYSLQYFEGKIRFLDREIRSLERKFLRKKRYSPRNYIKSLYHNDELENVLAQIEAYQLRINWCESNIKIKLEKIKGINFLNELRQLFQKIENNVLQEETNAMQNYFLQQETRVVQNKFRLYGLTAA